MSNISCENSDHVIFTNDNPRTESPKQIFDDMVHELEFSNYEIIESRDLAIKKGLTLLEENDKLMILGKGHEDYQIIGKEKKHFSDQMTVKKYMNIKE